MNSHLPAHLKFHGTHIGGFFVVTSHHITLAYGQAGQLFNMLIICGIISSVAGQPLLPAHHTEFLSNNNNDQAFITFNICV